VNPSDKRHPRFEDTAPLSFLLYPRAQQLGPKTPVEMCLGDAVGAGTKRAPLWYTHRQPLAHSVGGGWTCLFGG